MTKRFTTYVVLGSLLLIGLAPSAALSSYVIGSHDGLQISVWQHSELDRPVTVRADGMITFPPVGDIRAAGLTTEELANALEEQLFAYVRGTTQVTVTVVNFLSRYIIVSGQVAQPGRYAFEEIPNLFQIIGQAGGALPGARLSEVRVIRSFEGREETLTADVAHYVASGDPQLLPELMPGDLVFVPGPYGATEAGLAPAANVSILGAVGRPGVYPVNQVFSLVDAVALAGGLAPGADLRRIRVLSREPGGSQVVATLDLEEILRVGEPVHYPIRVGDAIFIPQARPGFLGSIFGGALTAISISRDLLNFVLLIDYINDRDRRN